jgi:hypothetical protein
MMSHDCEFFIDQPEASTLERPHSKEFEAGWGKNYGDSSLVSLRVIHARPLLTQLLACTSVP